MIMSKNNKLNFFINTSILRKADLALFLILLFLGISSVILISDSGRDGKQVLIKTGGELYGTYDLNQDQTIKVVYRGHHNNITIKNGKVSMSFSDCRNQNCVHQGKISNTSQAIICLPNQVVVEIVDNAKDGGDDIDVISN